MIMRLSNDHYPELDMQLLNMTEQTWDGPWLVEVRYQLAINDCSSDAAARHARCYIENRPPLLDESAVPVRVLHHRTKVLPYALDAFDMDEPDKEGE